MRFNHQNYSIVWDKEVFIHKLNTYVWFSEKKAISKSNTRIHRMTNKYIKNTHRKKMWQQQIYGVNLPHVEQLYSHKTTDNNNNFTRCRFRYTNLELYIICHVEKSTRDDRLITALNLQMCWRVSIESI